MIHFGLARRSGRRASSAFWGVWLNALHRPARLEAFIFGENQLGVAFVVGEDKIVAVDHHHVGFIAPEGGQVFALFACNRSSFRSSEPRQAPADLSPVWTDEGDGVPRPEFPSNAEHAHR